MDFSIIFRFPVNFFWISLWISCRCLQFFYGFPYRLLQGFLWSSYELPFGLHMDFPLISHRFPIDFSWISCGFPMDFWSSSVDLGFPYGFPMASCLPMVAKQIPNIHLHLGASLFHAIPILPIPSHAIPWSLWINSDLNMDPPTFFSREEGRWIGRGDGRRGPGEQEREGSTKMSRCC